MSLAVVRSLGAPRQLQTPQEFEDFEQEIVDQYLLACLGAGVEDTTLNSDCSVVFEFIRFLGRPVWAAGPEDAKATHAEILAQLTRIGELLGQIRDLQAEWTEDAIQRISTENSTLKQWVRQLTADNRTLDERLKAARSNLRFQDRRVADLEAQIAGT
ncbi:hypothetical protein [Streptomyces sp. NPDC048637]|uniref:hypothetical protein n=1 Tax=Streptomyces sp. NPDC048637 TaxID=3155636 RepID=UPI003436B9C9